MYTIHKIQVVHLYIYIGTTSYPGSFHYAPRWRKDPGPGWSRVSQILGDNKLFAQGWGAKFVLPI